MPVLFSRRRKRFDNSNFFWGGMWIPVAPIDQVGELLQFDIRHLRDADGTKRRRWVIAG